MIDIRATVYCSLGTLISASISDDYVQGNGLIKTKGNCELKGVYRPAIGTPVTFTYVKNGVTRAIPRYLFVLSSFADPFRRTTKVELGCKLTMQQGKKDKIQWGPYDDPLNAEVTTAEADIVTSPIHASSVAQKCLSELGVGGTATLSNKFSISKFDYSPGYVQILSDLYVSECYCGYMSSGSGLTVFPLNAPGGAARVLTKSELIDIGPIGVGQLPGEAVTVSYSTLKLKAPKKTADQLNQAADQPSTPTDPNADPTPSTVKRDWEQEVTYGPLTNITITYKKADGTSASELFQYTPVDTTTTSYDIWDRVVKRVSSRIALGAELNGSYIQTLFELQDGAGNTSFSSVPPPRAWGGNRYTIRTETRFTYKITAYELKETVDSKYGGDYHYWGKVETFEDLPVDPQKGDAYQVENRCYAEYIWDGAQWVTQLAKDDPKNTPPAYPEGYDALESETTKVVEPVLSVLGSVAPGYLDADNNLLPIDLTGYVTTSEITTYYDNAPRNVAVLNAEKQIDGIYDIPTSKVVTSAKRVYASTAAGQQDIAMRVEQGQTIVDFQSIAVGLVYDGTSVQLRSGRESTLQARPSKAERLAAQQTEDTSTVTKQENTASTLAPNGGYQTVSTSEVELALGSQSAQTRIDLSMPYAPDDVFVRSGSCPNVTYTAVPSDAPQKARQFGKAQNQLLLGNRYGMNIQTVPELMPDRPFASLVVSIGGVAALYATNGTTWTISSDGIIASTDALFIGGVGGSGELFFPTAPGITSLPSAPSIVDGVMTVTNTVPVWNETLKAEATVRVGMSVARLSYPLQLLTTVDAIRVKLGFDGARVLKVEVPLADMVAIAAVVPQVSTGIALSAPVATVALGAVTPVLANGAAVAIPAAAVALDAVAPVVVGGASVAVPAIDLQVSALAPVSAGPPGILISSPAAAVAIAGVAPAISLGAAVSVPSVDVAVTGLTPAGAGNIGNGTDMTVLTEDDLLALLF